MACRDGEVCKIDKVGLKEIGDEVEGRLRTCHWYIRRNFTGRKGHVC
jgi:hypothetical protein